MKKIQNPVFQINTIGPSGDDSNEFLIGAIDGKAAIELGEHIMKETESGFCFDGDVSIEGKIDLGSSTELATTKDLEGKQDKIDSSNELSSDLVDDTGKAHLFVSSAEKETWDGKSTVYANPSGSDGDDLTRISIDGTNYKIPSGGGSSPKVITTILDMFGADQEVIEGSYNTGTTFSLQIVGLKSFVNLISRYSTAVAQAQDGNWLYIGIAPYPAEEGLQSSMIIGAVKEEGEWTFEDTITQEFYFENDYLGNVYNGITVVVLDDSTPTIAEGELILLSTLDSPEHPISSFFQITKSV